MSADTAKLDGKLVFKIENKAPVALEDFSNSIRAFGRSYEDYIISKGLVPPDDGVKLFIHKLETGSLIAVLHSLAEQANLILGEHGIVKQTSEAFQHIDAIAPFLTHFNEIVQFFLGVKEKSDLENAPTKKEAEQLVKIFEPVAKDRGSNLNVQFNAPVYGNVTFNYSSQEANALQNSAKRFLGPALPSNETYRDEVLFLHQIRDAKTAAGDRGIIEAISKSPVKLWFASDDVKQAILGQPENPFHVAFVVDVTVKTVNERPALYQVLSVKDTFERPSHA